jgi:PAS domain S-box-containing protein
MGAQLEDSVEEIKRLQRCINDLVSVIALPAVWSGGEPVEIVRVLLDVLVEMLSLDLIYARLEVTTGEAPVETARVARRGVPAAAPREVGELVARWLGDDPQKWPPLTRHIVGDEGMTVVSLPLGLQGEIGVLVAGSRRADFPRQTERLVLSVAANQAAVGLQQARLLNGQRRVADELDERVAQRTSELAAANEALKNEVAERRRAEEALAASERNLKLTVDTIPTLAWSASTDGSAEFFNQHYLDYVGLTSEQASGWGWTAAVHPDDLNGLAATWAGILASEAPGETEARLRRHDGEYRWFLFSTNPLRDERGGIVKWFGTNTDIDDRRRAEEALRSNELNLRQMTETIPEMLWSATPEGAIDYCNARFLNYTGFSAKEVLDDGWQKTIHPDDAGRVASVWMSSVTTGAPYRVEVRTFHCADRTYRWCAVSALPLLDRQGHILKWHGTIVDVHDWKQAQEKLRRSEAFLVEAQHLSSTGSFSWRVATDEIIWSEQLYRIYELEAGVPVTLELIRTRVHPEDITLYEKMVGQARNGADDFEWQYRLMMPDRSIKYLHAVARATRDQDGGLEYIAAVQDVTDRRLSEEALGKLRTELAHVSRVATLGALTASIAHEVNQPLSGIITNASTCLRMLAADPPNVDGARETARRTIRDGHRASDVITRLRALFGKKGAATESVDLNEATREVIALSLSELQRSRVVMQTELADDLPTINGDRVQLQQVILNLLRNASDAMSGVEDRPRRLLVRTERGEGERVRLSVRDAGVGLDPQNADRLFQAFYTTKDDGMGIGLSVSRSIIESHQGRLWAEPNDGPGATFSFSIPHASAADTVASGVGAIPTPAVKDAERLERNS